MKKVLFVCSRNALRSPTAEQVFSGRRDLEVASAGLNHDSPQPLVPELIAWADVIFVMEKAHLRRLRARFRRHLGRQRLICLDIPDRFEYMDPELVEILEMKVSRVLGVGR